MISKNNTKYTFGEWHLILQGAFQSGILLFPINSLRKLYLSCKLLKGPSMHAWRQRAREGLIEDNGNARIFFNLLLKPDYSGKKIVYPILKKC